MTEQAALLRAVLEDPFDDAPRLVYADWLDENGDPDRAEFIRLQCELARIRPLAREEPHKGHRARVVALWPRVEALLQANRHWAAPFGRDPKSLHRLDDGLWLDVSAGWTTVVRRGFVEVVSTPPLPYGDRWSVFSAHPVTEVRSVYGPDRTADGGFRWSLDPNLSPDLLAFLPTAGDVFPTAEAARTALSRGYVRFGRLLASLPPLGG